MIKLQEVLKKKGLASFLILSATLWAILSISLLTLFTNSTTYSVTQIISSFLFVLSGGYLPLIEAFISDIELTTSIKFGFPLVVLVLCLPWVYPYSKTKNYAWLIPASSIWIFSGWLYLGAKLT